jgi:hypothetical protein
MYNAEPTMIEFHRSDALVRGLAGPIGSGKSVACCEELLIRATQQAPNKQKVRKSRWGVFRSTYPQLESTTIQTFQKWIPESICPIKYGSPISGRLRQPLADGTEIDAQFYFISMDKPKDAEKVTSLELTGAWFNEARETSYDIIKAILSRTGRYPSKDEAPLTWSGLIMDTNQPDTDHWWYKFAEKTKPPGWEFFKQPGALIRLPNGVYVPNPAAENVKNQQLGYNYWLRMITYDKKDENWIKVMIMAEYGSVSTDKPVYAGFYNDNLHVSKEPLLLYKGLPLIGGWDFGLTPAFIVAQQTPRGQLRILREYICPDGAIKQFAINAVQPALKNEFPGMKFAMTWADPAGEQRNQANETTCVQELKRLTFPVEITNTNSHLPRRQAVINYLTRLADGEPAFIMDPSCHVLRKGFLDGYKYNRVQISGEDRFKDEPDKNEYSHPHDALQYLCLGSGGGIIQQERADQQLIQGRAAAVPSGGGWRGHV